jgi:hypothetical protein
MLPRVSTATSSDQLIGESCGPDWLGLLAERPLTTRGERKAYLLNLPASASLLELVRLARGRWPIEGRC